METDDRTAQERDEDIALELTGVVLEFLRTCGVVGSVAWDGGELLVGWREGEGDES